MNPKGIKNKIAIAQENIQKEISAFAKGGFYAAGLAGEGYNGGYRDALSDVLLLLNDGLPCIKPGWWEVRES